MNVEDKPKRSLSELINQALREALREERDDLAVFDARSAEPTLSFEEMVKRLDLDGKV